MTTMDDIINKAQTPARALVDELHSLRLDFIKTITNDCLQGRHKEIFEDEFNNILTQLRKTAGTSPANFIEVKTKLDCDDSGMYNELFAFIVYGLFKKKLKALDKRFECSTFLNDKDHLCFQVKWPYTDQEEKG